MKEEETMQYVMKFMLFAVTIGLGVALTIVPAHAQSGSRVLANIPFDFSVGNTTLKAGSYTVELLQSGMLAFSSNDGKEHQFALTVPGNSGNQDQAPHLLFTRYGSEAFLSSSSQHVDCGDTDLAERLVKAASRENRPATP